MRIKKKQIEEAILGAGQQQQASSTTQGKAPSQEDIANLDAFSRKVKEVNDEIKNNPIGAFVNPVGENFDPNYGRAEDIEYQADLQQQMELIKQEIMKQQDDFLNSPKGIEYMQNILKNRANQPKDNPTDDLPFESFKDKRKVIKTIKLKDLK